MLPRFQLWRKPAVAAALCLIAGPVLTLFSTWAMVIWGPFLSRCETRITLSENMSLDPNNRRWMITPIARTWDATVYGSMMMNPGTVLPKAVVPADAPVWLRRENAQLEASHLWTTRGNVFAAFGWPFRTLASEVQNGFPPSPLPGTNPIPIWPPLLSGPVASDPARQFLPTQVIWRGFIFNSVLFGAPFLVLFFLIPATRRIIRRRRSRCIACGYDLRATQFGAPCPECGRTKPSVGD